MVKHIVAALVGLLLSLCLSTTPAVFPLNIIRVRAPVPIPIAITIVVRSEVAVTGLALALGRPSLRPVIPAPFGHIVVRRRGGRVGRSGRGRVGPRGALY